MMIIQRMKLFFIVLIDNTPLNLPIQQIDVKPFEDQYSLPSILKRLDLLLHLMQ